MHFVKTIVRQFYIYLQITRMYICATIEYLQKCVTLYPSNTVGVAVGAEAAHLSGTLDA
jgi:hypothetical protein